MIGNFELLFEISNVVIFNLGPNREEFALNLLQQFKDKLNSAKQSTQAKKSEELDEDEDSWYFFVLIKNKSKIINFN